MARKPKQEMADLTPNEQLVVARLLAGGTVAQIAREIGKDAAYVGRVTQRPHVVALVKAERGDLLYRDFQRLQNLAPLWFDRAKEILSIPVDPDAPNPKVMAVQAQVGRDILDRLGMAQSAPVAPSTPGVSMQFSAATAADMLDRLRRSRGGAAAPVEVPTDGEITIDVHRGGSRGAEPGLEAPALTSGGDSGSGPRGVPGGAPAG